MTGKAENNFKKAFLIYKQTWPSGDVFIFLKRAEAPKNNIYNILRVFLFFLCHDLRLKGTDQEIMDTCLDFPQTNSKEAKSLGSSKISSETTT